MATVTDNSMAAKYMIELFAVYVYDKYLSLSKYFVTIIIGLTLLSYNKFFMFICQILGQIQQLSKNDKAKRLLVKAPILVEKWQEVLKPFNDQEKPSMEIDLDLYDDEIVETGNDDIKVTSNHFRLIK